MVPGMSQGIHVSVLLVLSHDTNHAITKENCSILTWFTHLLIILWLLTNNSIYVPEFFKSSNYIFLTLFYSFPSQSSQMTLRLLLVISSTNLNEIHEGQQLWKDPTCQRAVYLFFSCSVLMFYFSAISNVITIWTFQWRLMQESIKYLCLLVPFVNKVAFHIHRRKKMSTTLMKIHLTNH